MMKSMATLAYSAFGEAFDKGFAKLDGSQDDFDFAAKTWVPIAEKCLVEGKTSWSS
jgi:hypothetical protein